MTSPHSSAIIKSKSDPVRFNISAIAKYLHKLRSFPSFIALFVFSQCFHAHKLNSDNGNIMVSVLPA